MNSNTQTSDIRLLKLQEWLDELYSTKYALSIASADASFRRYFRLRINHQSFIIMDAPPEHESLSPFKEIAQAWKNKGINVPVIYAVNEEDGFMQIEDFGNKTLLEYIQGLNNEALIEVYKIAVDQLIELQKRTQDQAANDNFNLPVYTHQRLNDECELFREWYLGVHCQYSLDGHENKQLDQLFEFLIAQSEETRKVTVHRDYHSRNLMVNRHCELGIIDFQDAMQGSIYYDVASLLKDCYYKFNDKQRQSLFEYFYRQAAEQNLLTDNFEAAQRYFDWVGIQRHLKAIGIFSRLSHRDNKHHYLEDIPRTASYILDLESRYPVLEYICKLLKQTLNISTD